MRVGLARVLRALSTTVAWGNTVVNISKFRRSPPTMDCRRMSARCAGKRCGMCKKRSRWPARTMRCCVSNSNGWRREAMGNTRSRRNCKLITLPLFINFILAKVLFANGKYCFQNWVTSNIPLQHYNYKINFSINFRPSKSI